jgi:C-terminal processing protease CtpA/Prc
MDLVGITLRPEAGGGYSVLGVAAEGEQPAVPGLAAGDLIVQVDSSSTSGATMGTVVDALRGAPGDTHTLLVQRGDRRWSITATVQRLLELAPRDPRQER